MASINSKEFDNLARLSNLSFSEEQKDAMMGELTKLCAFVDAVVDFSGYPANEEKGLKEECSGFRGMCGDLDFTELREDALGQSLPAEELLKNTENENGCFKVRQVKL